MSGPLDILDAVGTHARHRGATPAIVSSDGVVTYNELARRVDEFVSGFLARGRRPGERVGIATFKGGIAAELIVAVQAAGLQPVLLSLAVGRRLPDLVANLGIRELVVGPEFDEHDPHFPDGVTVWETSQGSDAVRTAMSGGDTNQRLSWRGQRTPESVTTIQFTGGSTGAPKPIVRTVASDWWDALGRSYAFRCGEGDRWVVASPYNLGVLAGATRAMYSFGGTVVVLDDVTPESLEEAIRGGVTILPLQAPTWSALLDGGQAQLLPAFGLRTAVVTGQRMQARRLTQLAEAITPRAEVVVNYGTSETGTIAVNRSVSDDYARPFTVGRPLPYVHARIVDASGNPVGVGILGEIEVRGPAVSAGYLDQLVKDLHEPLTAVPQRRGWFATKDLGRFDENGVLSVFGRREDLVTVGESVIIPAAVEETLGEIAGVRRAVVVEPEGIGGVAVLVEAAAALEWRALDRALEGDLPGAYRVIAVERIPHTPAGKPDRPAARRLAAQRWEEHRGATS